MSATTSVVEAKFGAPGVTDARMYHPGLVAVERTWDFSKTATSASTEYALLGLPKGFVALGAFIGSGKYPLLGAMDEARLRFGSTSSTREALE